MNNDLDIITALVKLEKQTNELDKSICKYKDKEIKRLQERINKAIELLEKENYHCPRSLTVEKAYIIEVEKINNVISILKRGENNE